MAIVNPMSTEFRAKYVKIASSSATGTMSQKLQELSSTYTGLSTEKKLRTILVAGTAVYHLVNSDRGIYVRTTISLAGDYVEQVDIVNNQYLFDNNGTRSDISSQTNTIVFELWLLE